MASTQDFSNSFFSNELLNFHNFDTFETTLVGDNNWEWVKTAGRIASLILINIWYSILVIGATIEEGIAFIAKKLQRSPLHFSTPRSPEGIDPNNHLLSIPLEIQLKIFQYFQIDHLIMVSLVNKDYYNTIFYHVLPSFINSNVEISISQLGFNFSCTKELLRRRGNMLNQLCIRGGGHNSAQQLISECPNLKHLKIRRVHNWFCNRFASPLARTIGQLTELTALDLSYNYIGHIGITYILENLTNLTHLNLKYNSLELTCFRDPLNLTEFTQKLGNLKKLQSLNLSGNSLYANTITQIIQSLPNLAHLDLSKNLIMIDQFKDLIEELLQRPNFSSLKLNLKHEFKPKNKNEQRILKGLIRQIKKKFPECNLQFS